MDYKGRSHVDQPATSFLILRHFPHWLDSLLEDVVVTGAGQATWRADIVVQPGIKWNF